ncbi:MAG: hypothetical protein IKQ87_00735, partial [Clostridia bacterium]|nr:hypothetical protein [Clostridia bacterium]
SETPENYGRILRLILDGIGDCRGATCPVKRGSVPPKPLRYGDSGGKYLIILTKEESEFRFIGKTWFFNLLTEIKDNNLDGLIVDPFDEAVKVDRAFIESVLEVFATGVTYGRTRNGHTEDCYKENSYNSKGGDTGNTVNTKDDEEDLSHVIEADRPMPEEAFGEIEEILNGLILDDSDSFLVLEFRNFVGDDKVNFMQVKHCDEGYHLEIAFSREDEGKENRIIAVDDISLEQTVELFRRIAVNGEKTADIPFIAENFYELDWPGAETDEDQDPGGEDGE